MKNSDKPAMPVNLDGHEWQGPTDFDGLTKREMFAMHAMQGLLSDADYADLYETAPEWREGVAKASVEFADKLLKELEK